MEIWDLYSKDGTKLNKTCIRGDGLPENTYHLVVHIIIKNSQGEYLIQKRADDKDLWPGKWAYTGGSAFKNESSETAALRELSEETGIHLSKGDLSFKERLYYHDYFADLWFAVVDADASALVFQEEEVSALDYVNKKNIIEMIKSGSFHAYRDDYTKLVFNL